jgi:hypothetical protein
MKMNARLSLLGSVLAMSSLQLLACGGPHDEDDLVQVRSAVEACVFGAPVITEIREETPGPVAPGISKIYFVTVRNGNSAGCGPSTLTFVADSFQFFSVVAQPSSVGGVAAGATTTFRVTVTSDPSVPEGTTNIGFTVVANPGGGSVRGALVYTVSLTNPVGCNRQPPAVSVDSFEKSAPPQTPVVFHVTVRNVDNRECGADTFSLSPFSLHFVSVTANGPFVIAPQGSAVFDLTITPSDLFGPGATIDESFTVLGAHHGNLTTTASVRVRIR